MKTSTHSSRVATRSLAESITATLHSTFPASGMCPKLEYPSRVPRRLNNWEVFLDEEGMLFNGGTAAGGMRW